ncbi:amidohydrolase family protein [Rhizobium bangladeshense]|uniref:Amidohydrolase family protein n=1 Tax=Rhizobium bangladeshense TaxID=1138189 RepID=A0ABS7LEQ5_9HYPH|nr:amidohydrolase family protein [Rhizobium bangladeshense]MBX4866010.1 amidohydrolase family protein [Rhizobium bangladeshense]MBX4872102.1 amidohydrolase family protein [Rhizobium bangladeshense]MBX4882590.1 amidohydrolase family protein [Rhizobium bangladeshense]MBX4889224.1 amidohydrolase family protein [Rhizobium bangladeshense]MBX4896131.1 amidohydrolase family protein [Rhizobium bangladeshense]
MDFDLVLQGTVVLPDRIVEKGYVAVHAGKIAEIGLGVPPAARERHLLGKALILPGAIDAQVHSLSQRDQEDFIWSTRSAAAGGVTTIVDMPYDEGNLVCSAAAVKRKIEHASPQARVDFALYGTVDPQEGPARIPEMVEAGVAAFKFSTFGTDPKRFPRIPPALLDACFAAIAPTGLTAGVHNEDDEAVRSYMEQVKASGITDWRAHGLSRPAITELLAMHTIFETGANTGCPSHVVHCSLGRGYDIARAYRRDGFAATVECCIHYLTLDEENDVRRLGGKAKINPPLRPRAEVERLWRKVAEGDVWLVSTDHVSWSENRKTNPDMLANASGVPGLEVMVPLFVKGALERGIPLTWAARLMAENPAKHFRLDHIKGALTSGKDADITVLEPRESIYDASASGNNVVGWSPYNGIRLPWTVSATYLRGEKIAEGGKVLAEPGTGRFVRPPPRQVISGATA